MNFYALPISYALLSRFNRTEIIKIEYLKKIIFLYINITINIKKFSFKIFWSFSNIMIKEEIFKDIKDFKYLKEKNIGSGGFSEVKLMYYIKNPNLVFAVK